MIGKQTIQIAGNQFAQGLTTSDFLGDGGIGTSSSSLSLIATPGVVRATATSSMTGTIPVGDTIIASCEDPTTTSSLYGKIVVTDGGSFSAIGGTTFNSFFRNSPFSAFVSGVTDMVSFNGNAWATRQTDIAKITLPTTGDTTWWTGTKSQTALTGNARHPLIVFEGLMWIGDGNKLHSVDSSETIVASKLVLNANERIVSLGIDPNTGLMMIGVRTVYSTSDDIPGANFVYLYDGISSKPRRKIAVDGTIWGFQPVGGQVFVGINNFVGVWNGAGVTFLRRLTNTANTSTSLPNRMRLSHFQNTLLVVDNKNTILAYGDVANGKKVWWPLYKTAAGAQNIDLITNIGNDTSSSIPQSPFILATGGSQVATVVRPLDTVTVGSGVFYTNNINFERPVVINGMEVFTTGITTTAGIGGVSIIDEESVTTTPTLSTFKVASGTKYRFHFDFNKKLQTLQPKITIDTQAFGIVKVVIYYTVVE